MLRLEPLEPYQLIRSLQSVLGFFGSANTERRERLRNLLCLTTGRELLVRKLPDRLQHREAGLLAHLSDLQETGVDECLDPRLDIQRSITVSVSHRLSRLEGAATGKDAQPLEEVLLLGTEEIDAPGDGVT